MDRITVYQKPPCSTCRQVHAALRAAGVDFNTVDYFLEPLSAATLERLLGKMGIKPRGLLRTKEERYKRLGLEGSHHTDGELLALMVLHPDLMQRPIVERGNRAILARPAERLQEIL